ncbi:hypothetical protein PspCFBP13509_11010 [Pseudomonas sp. CFBP13509]|jgi:hypothetical protein|uniref:hypothetical protein n=1 Tax=Pseudomonas sp. CFBP13509 TaxID=2184008 RepID=UPI0010C00287|nr:hypothetical protein [Pseudomonas sp. CFBP13509]TKJ79972.1 hypothetical protein PspCFBP13509_11010 [Pseudomonas sp. CFBP13509]
MNRQRLICDSSAVLTRDAAKGLTLLIGLLNGAIEGAQSPHERFGQSALPCGLTAVVHAYPAARKEPDEVVRFHLADFDSLCLRCGALFNEAAEIKERLNPG